LPRLGSPGAAAMTLCIEVMSDSLRVVGEYSEACTGYALLTAQEYASTPTLAALFAVPEPETVQTAFAAGLTLPLMLWLSAWAFGVVVSYINSRTDDTVINEE